MSPTERPPVRRNRPAPLEVEVTTVEKQSGGIVRVSFEGEALAAFAWPGAASHLKFFPPVPEDPGVTLELPDGAVPRPLSRTYTPRAFDEDRRLLVVDFLLHGEGPAAHWAMHAHPGDRARVSVPRASYRPDAEASWLLLAGDDSAIPAIGTILEAGFGLPTEVVLETQSPISDRPIVPSGALVTIRWVEAIRDRPGARLEAAIREFELPSSPGAIWVACEAQAVRRVRSLLLSERAFPASALVTRGYWRQGEPNHPDHDFGEDVASA